MLVRCTVTRWLSSSAAATDPRLLSTGVATYSRVNVDSILNLRNCIPMYQYLSLNACDEQRHIIDCFLDAFTLQIIYSTKLRSPSARLDNGRGGQRCHSQPRQAVGHWPADPN